MYKTMQDIREAADSEGYDYFLFSYTSPKSIPDDAEKEALMFRAKWQRLIDVAGDLWHEISDELATF